MCGLACLGVVTQSSLDAWCRLKRNSAVNNNKKKGNSETLGNLSGFVFHGNLALIHWRVGGSALGATSGPLCAF